MVDATLSWPGVWFLIIACGPLFEEFVEAFPSRGSEGTLRVPHTEKQPKKAALNAQYRSLQP